MKPARNKNTSKQTINKTNLKLSYSFIILLYALVPTFTPNFYTLDSNGPKFLALAILNLFSYLFLLSGKDFRSKLDIQKEFFTKTFGLVYLSFLFISLLSFIKAINISESIIQFTKTFTAFSSVYILFLIFKMDKRYFRQMMILLTFILLIDCFTVFANIYLYINGKIGSIAEIKSVYSNKNGLSSSIFVKIPVAMWLHLYMTGKWKRVGLVTLLFAFLATLFMSSRTFYLGLVLLLVVFLSFSIIRYFQSRDKNYLTVFLQYISALVIAVIIFSFVQGFLYPGQKEGYTTNITERLSTVSNVKEPSRDLRLRAWKNTLQLIRENPLLGIGTGNWKIVELKMENQVIPDYTYMSKNHNDFLEITAENGLFGGFFYLALFVFPFLFVIRRIKDKATDEHYKYLLVPALGLLCYSVDAFFNFPADRAEIQGLFAVYLAASLCFCRINIIKDLSTRNYRLFFIVLFSALMVCSIFILISNFRSLHYQRIAQEEITGNGLKHSSEYMISGFPDIPTLTDVSEPIAVIKARYLINERKYEQAIKLLQNDRSSPYDGRQEYFMAMAYEKLGDTTNNLSCLNRMMKIKPCYYNCVAKICNILEKRGDYQTATNYLSDFVEKQKSEKIPWLYLSVLYEKMKDPGRSLAIIDTALKYLPKDSLLISRELTLKAKLKQVPYDNLLKEGFNLFSKKDYRNAIIRFSEIIKKDTSVMIAYEYRGLCFYFLKEYIKSLDDFSNAIRIDPQKGELHNYLGGCYHLLGNDTGACRQFEIGIKLGYSDSKTNYEKYCKK